MKLPSLFKRKAPAPIQADAESLAHGHTVYLGGFEYTETSGLFGRTKRKRFRLMTHNGPEHVFVSAPTRSGKGVGLVLPTMLAWTGSVVAHDIKNELYSLSAGYNAKAGKYILRFAPAMVENSPLDLMLGDYTQPKSNPVGMEQESVVNLADAMVATFGKQAGLADSDTATASRMLQAAMLHIRHSVDYRDGNRTMGAMAELFDTHGIEGTLAHLRGHNHDFHADKWGGGCHPSLAPLLNKLDASLESLATAEPAIRQVARLSMDRATTRYNPMDEIRTWSKSDVKDASNLADLIIDSTGKGKEGGEKHWTLSGIKLTTAIILHVMYAPHVKDKTLRGVATFLASFGSYLDAYEDMRNTIHDPTGKMGWKDAFGKPMKVHPYVWTEANSMIGKGEDSKEATSIISTMDAELALYKDPVVADATSESEFRISDLMRADRPVMLYLVASPSDKDRVRPLFRIVTELMIRRLTEAMSFQNGRSVADYNFRLLFMLDEFPALGKMNALTEGAAFVAGYGIKYMIITQSPQQLRDDKLYGAQGAESLLSNCHAAVYFAPNDDKTAEELSKKCGKTKYSRINKSISGKRVGVGMDGASTAEQQERVDLLPSEAARALPNDELLLFISGKPPIKGKKIFYYKIPLFLNRAKIPPPLVPGFIRDPRAAKAPVKPVATPRPTTPVANTETAVGEEGVAASVMPDAAPPRAERPAPTQPAQTASASILPDNWLDSLAVADEAELPDEPGPFSDSVLDAESREEVVILGSAPKAKPMDNYMDLFNREQLNRAAMGKLMPPLEVGGLSFSEWADQLPDADDIAADGQPLAPTVPDCAEPDSEPASSPPPILADYAATTVPDPVPDLASMQEHAPDNQATAPKRWSVFDDLA